MQKKYKYMTAAGMAILLLASAAFFWKNWDVKLPDVNSGTSDGRLGGVGTSDVQKFQSGVLQNGIYRNERFAFSLSIPDGFKVTENNPDEFTTLVLIEASGKIAPSSTLGVEGSQTPSVFPGAVEERAGFQIFIMPFDEPGPVNKERILIDMPDAVVDDPQMAQINGIDAFLFFGKDEDIGRTREVWFANDGYLYQVSSWASFDEELSKIMATFKFK